MSSDVPPPQGAEAPTADLERVWKKLAEHEDRLDSRVTSAEAKLQVALRWDTWIAVLGKALALVVSVAVIVFMMCFAWRGLELARLWVTPFLGVPKAYAIALVVAPIVSITTVTGGLLAAAFFKNKSDEASNAADGALDLAKRTVGLD